VVMRRRGYAPGRLAAVGRFSAACKAPPFHIRGAKCGLRGEGTSANAEVPLWLWDLHDLACSSGGGCGESSVGYRIGSSRTPEILRFYDSDNMSEVIFPVCSKLITFEKNEISSIPVVWSALAVVSARRLLIQ